MPEPKTPPTGAGTEESTTHVHVESAGESAYSGARAKADYVAEQIRTAARDVVDTLLRRVPPEVVEHVNNSRKELLMALKGLIDRELGSIDRSTHHAYDLHKPKDKQEPGPGAS